MRNSAVTIINRLLNLGVRATLQPTLLPAAANLHGKEDNDH